MTPVWVDRIGGFNVERRESKRPDGQAYIPLSNPRAFVIHTTEGDTVNGAWNTLDTKHAAPHFIAGEGRLVQMRPLNVQAATLVDGGAWHPNSVGWQVECVGHAQGLEYKLPSPTWNPLVALTTFMHDVMRVPLARPDGWRDDLRDISTMLATNNTRRLARTAVTFRGILQHMEIPDQATTWHWDAGALDFSALINEATMGVAVAADERLDHFSAGYNAFAPGKALNPDWPPFKRFGFSVARDIARGLTAREANELFTTPAEVQALIDLIAPGDSTVAEHQHVPGGVKR